jgi:hypothetical protein
MYNLMKDIQMHRLTVFFHYDQIYLSMLHIQLEFQLTFDHQVNMIDEDQSKEYHQNAYLDQHQATRKSLKR